MSRCVFLELPLSFVFIVRGHAYLGPVGSDGFSPSTEPAPLSSLSFPSLLLLKETEFRLAFLADYFGISKSETSRKVFYLDERASAGTD